MNYEELNGTDKAAILMMTIGKDLSATIMKGLERSDLERLSRAVAGLGGVPVDVADRVVDEFCTVMSEGGRTLRGGIDVAKRMLNTAVDNQSAERIIDELALTPNGEETLSELVGRDPIRVANMIRDENPQTLALLMTELEPEVAAKIIANLPDSKRPEVMVRLASIDSVSPEIADRVTDAVRRKLRGMGGAGAKAVAGIDGVVGIINQSTRELGKQLLSSIEEMSPEIALQIRDALFVFDDVAGFDDTTIREILKATDRNDLALALKGGTEDLRELFFRNMSSRAVGMLKEEIDMLGAVKVKDVEKAQKNIVEAILKLEEEGTIELSSGAEDEYVV